ncbi:MAG: thioredoxin family protein [Firmicutes bacterium]|jgi:small redox-active disulfide protein 2|nr:thioredoxin family protein [Bacillota bacterium]
MEIKILGMGCPKCRKLEAMVREVVQETNVDASVMKVTDIKEITKAGVMLTPGLMIDDDVKFCGKLPPKNELAKIIKAGVGD